MIISSDQALISPLNLGEVFAIGSGLLLHLLSAVSGGQRCLPKSLIEGMLSLSSGFLTLSSG